MRPKNIQDIYKIALGNNKRFPNNISPYHIMTRIMEELGELAEQVNHFEGSGIKREKHGQPSRDHLAEEIWHVISCALQLCEYYGVAEEMDISISNWIEKYKKEGYIENLED